MISNRRDHTLHYILQQVPLSLSPHFSEIHLFEDGQSFVRYRTASHTNKKPNQLLIRRLHFLARPLHPSLQMDDTPNACGAQR
ncbi:hypothetical protein [Sphingobacterium griseoflavum]|uniref:hypothetical protein n=1 Tax=Sphingobacterium griseoflavum TaxID=1474952 RepID=UPI001671B778|nr:hypothetical protein [Sphingobacterium griseoflavum]